MSNMASTVSGEASVSSSSKQSQWFSQHQEHLSDDENPPAKKKRNLPGNPDPESEVIALSPKTLLATNRFICEICNKGFQRDQNLQLHRRGHNLPWKLKQRSKIEVIKKKVYVCPEQSCVHHHPSRALGDLTGIKKHFSRKHGEKKWKCDKCSKRYAVQSDCKAHSKVCGTREYRCDCGTLFSRRDSFITHRAFCDALAEETARAMTTTTTTDPLIMTNTHFDHLHAFHPKSEQQQDRHLRPHLINDNNLPPWLGSPSSSSSSPVFNCQDQNPNTGLPAFTATPAMQSPTCMSATALLQKAAQMEATMSRRHVTTTPPPCTAGMLGVCFSSRDLHHKFMSPTSCGSGSGSDPNAGPDLGPSSSFIQEMMIVNSLSSSYDDEFVIEGMGMKNQSSAFRQTPGGHGGGGDGMTRDFLGLKPLTENDIFTLAGLGNCMTSNNNTTSTHHQQETHKSWQT
ncbi:hypothetical protein RND81_01G062300 [Saponaria officinalis]|uniref:C2H2-type domain-containing protein n=1 Tax=Saponaria officinalis TaxID=3572 RepID=A0AAW1N5Z2_SAPOF